jgi:MFS family permease
MESSASAGRVASAVLDPRRWGALALLWGAFFMVFLDGTITIVALPLIGAGLRFSEQGLPWVLSAFALTFGGLLLFGGRAADLLGRRACSWPAPCSSRPRRCCAGRSGGRRHCWRPVWSRAPAQRS